MMTKKTWTGKLRFFFDIYNLNANVWKQSDRKLAVADFVDRTIKWTSEALKRNLVQEQKAWRFDSNTDR